MSYPALSLRLIENWDLRLRLSFAGAFLDMMMGSHFGIWKFMKVVVLLKG